MVHDLGRKGETARKRIETRLQKVDNAQIRILRRLEEVHKEQMKMINKADALESRIEETNRATAYQLQRLFSLFDNQSKNGR